MFTQTAEFYDQIYSSKVYAAEAQKVAQIIHQKLGQAGDQAHWRLLDVACGTGHHLYFLKQWFQAEGLDISAELLAVARQRNPELVFHQGDMADFGLGKVYDAITCLFSAIGYLKTLDRVDQAVGSMLRHLAPHGVIIIEPWFTPDAWNPGHPHATLIDEQPDMKIARVNTSFVEGRLSWFDLHYLVGTPRGTEHFVERHELGLFETCEIRAILEGHGLTVVYDPEGLIGRGLWIAQF